MAETNLGDIDRPTAPRAGVNKVGPGWQVEGAYAVASDRTVHLPFNLPGPVNPPAPYVEPPPPPTEAEHRAKLATALAAQQAADDAMAKAAEAHGKAVKLFEDRQQELAGFADLEQEELSRTLAGLRGEVGFVVDQNHHDRIVEREWCRTDIAVAERAVAMLATELATACGAAEQAAKAVKYAVASVLAHHADRLADEHAEHLAQAARRKEALLSFNHAVANSGVKLTGKVSSLLLSEPTSTLARLRDTSAWTAARDRLLADPEAAIVIDLPPPPAPKPAWRPIVPHGPPRPYWPAIAPDAARQPAVETEQTEA